LTPVTVVIHDKANEVVEEEKGPERTLTRRELKKQVSNFCLVFDSLVG